MQQRNTTTLDCPKGMIGRVIGKNGETVKALQVFTGASIQIDQVSEPARIIMSGTPQALQLAASMVTDIINGTFRGFSLLRQLAQVDSRQPGQPPLASQMVYAPGYGLIPATEDAAANRIGKVADHQQSLLGQAGQMQGAWPQIPPMPTALAAGMYQAVQTGPTPGGADMRYVPGAVGGQQVQPQYQAQPGSHMGLQQQGLPGQMQVQYMAPGGGLLLAPGGTPQVAAGPEGAMAHLGPQGSSYLVPVGAPQQFYYAAPHDRAQLGGYPVAGGSGQQQQQQQQQQLMGGGQGAFAGVGMMAAPGGYSQVGPAAFAGGAGSYSIPGAGGFVPPGSAAGAGYSTGLGQPLQQQGLGSFGAAAAPLRAGPAGGEVGQAAADGAPPGFDSGAAAAAAAQAGQVYFLTTAPM